MHIPLPHEVLADLDLAFDDVALLFHDAASAWWRASPDYSRPTNQIAPVSAVANDSAGMKRCE
jgi:hypothetical protein